MTEGERWWGSVRTKVSRKWDEGPSGEVEGQWRPSQSKVREDQSDRPLEVSHDRRPEVLTSRDAKTMGSGRSEYNLQE